MQDLAELMPDEVAQKLIMFWQQEMEKSKALGKLKAQRQPMVPEMQDGKMAGYSL